MRRRRHSEGIVMNCAVIRNGCVSAVAATLGIVFAAALPAGALAWDGERASKLSSVANAGREAHPTLLQTPVTEPINISAQPTLGNHLPACHLAGSVTLWVSRSLRVLDDVFEERAIVEAGLLQFGKRSTLEGCSPDGVAVDLSDHFANFLVAEEGASTREGATALASQLAQDFFHLAQPDSVLVPLVNSIKVSAVGSVAHAYTIVLIRDAKSASFDAVIHRETVRTKFSPRLPEADRRASRVKWSSAQHD
jgi:hypothetical protein